MLALDLIRNDGECRSPREPSKPRELPPGVTGETGAGVAPFGGMSMRSGGTEGVAGGGTEFTKGLLLKAGDDGDGEGCDIAGSVSPGGIAGELGS